VLVGGLALGDQVVEFSAATAQLIGSQLACLFGVSGTVFADGRPRIVNIKGIRMDAEFGPSMIYITNQDKPGFIGRFSSTLGEAGINIATFHLGRDAPGGNAIALIEIDGELPQAVLAAVRALPQVQQAKLLRF